MPRVFSGKVVIPGNKIDDWLKAKKEAEKARAPFRKHLEGLHEEFYEYLKTKYSERTADKHGWIVDMFVQFLCGYTDVQSIEEITRGMANTQFRQWYKRKVLEPATADDIRVALKRFFQFLDAEKGIHNPKVLESLK